jgi:uncharacterized phosphosugar-binding protein
MIVNNFFKTLQELFQQIVDTQKDKFSKAATVIADCIENEKNGAIFHVWGTGGHSSMIAEEALYRKGGLANVDPILDQGISLGHGALKEINGMERIPGYATAVLDYRRVKKGDVLLLGSAYGVNVITIEAALEAKKRGVTVIAITSPTFSHSVDKNHPGRHESKKDLYEVADIFIDSFVPPGDAVVKIEGFDQKVAPIGTIIQSAVYQCLVAMISEELVKRGSRPKIWTNALSMGGVEANKSYIDQYYGLFKSL